MNKNFCQILTILTLIGASGCLGGVLKKSQNGHQPTETADIERTTSLGAVGNVTWYVYDATQTVVFDVTMPTKGWIGFGMPVFSAEAGNLDLIRGGVRDDGTVYFADRNSFRPWHVTKVDEQQDYTLISASEDDQGTHLKFSRPFVTGDVHDSAIQNVNTFFIWSYGPSDDPETMFVTRGSVRVNVLSTKDESVEEQ